MDISSIRKAIAGEKLDGWLFFNFLHRDPLSDSILGIDPGKINSRPWYYLIPVRGEPVRICHAVEPRQLDDLPGEQAVYSSRRELEVLLTEKVSIIGSKWGAQFSEELTTVSTLDHGTALMLMKTGMNLHSSAGLIQRLSGLLDCQAITSHEKASGELYEIINSVWDRISEHFRSSEKTLFEWEVQKWITDEFEARGMETEHMPIVAGGKNSGNPHYAPEDNNNPVLPDAVLQLDIWAKYKAPGSIFADISWIGWTGPASDIPDDVSRMFEAVCKARDRCVSFIESRLKDGKPVSGAEADAETRKVLIGHGYEKLIKHRTGHGIDSSVHGSGTGLDSVEFPDNRPLLEGSCFSIEPGLYSSEFGMRTEIDALITEGRLKVSGPGRQKKILTIE